MCQRAGRRQGSHMYRCTFVGYECDFLCLLHKSQVISSCLPLSSHLEQDFLCFSTLLSVHSESCFSNTSSHVSSQLFVAAAVLKQVLDAIWPASMFC